MAQGASRSQRCFQHVPLIISTVLALMMVSGDGSMAATPDWYPVSGATIEIAGEAMAIDAPARLGGVHARNISHLYNLTGKRGVIRFEALGEGKVGFAIWGKDNVANYGPTVSLTEEWQAIELDYYFEGPERISIYSESGYAAKFQLRNFNIIETVQPERPDMEVRRLDFEVEEYPGVNGRVVKVANAFGGAAMWGKRWYEVTRIPAPLTSRPLYYFLRIQCSTDKEITANLRNGYQKVARAKLQDAETWKWLRIGPVDAAAVYPAVKVYYETDPETEILLDRVVISTSPELGDLDEAVKSIPISVSGRVRIGRGDEVTPENTIAVGRFMLNQTKKLATEQTTVRFAYSETHLFATFHCQESALNPVENRLHEFRAAVYSDDDTRIYDDDCVLLLVKPDPSADVAYDFVVNGNGALLDAKCSAPDYWGSRKFEWSSGAKVTATRDTEGWTVNMAIPFQTLGFQPKADARLYVMAGRLQASKKEASAWQVLNTGFHENTFGELILDEKVPALAVTEMPCFTPGRNRLAFSEPVAIAVTTQYGDALRREFAVGKELLSSLTEGELHFQFTASRPGDLALYYESPLRTVHVSALSLNFRDAQRVILNGVEAHSGAAPNWGVNTLKSDGGEFSVGDFSFHHPGGEMTLLAGHTQVWPNWEEAGGVSVSRGGLQQLLVRPLGVKGHLLRDYQLFFELPADYTVEGASGYYGVWPLKVELVGETVRHGKKYLRHAVSFGTGVPYDPSFSEPLHRYVAFVFRVPLAAEAGDPIYYYCGSKSSNVVETPQKIQVHLLPPLNGRQPEELIVQL